MNDNILVMERNIAGKVQYSNTTSIDFEKEFKLLRYWLKKPKVEDRFLRKLISEFGCMMIGNEQGIVSGDNNRVLRKKQS